MECLLCSKLNQVDASCWVSLVVLCPLSGPGKHSAPGASLHGCSGVASSFSTKKTQGNFLLKLFDFWASVSKAFKGR